VLDPIEAALIETALQSENHTEVMRLLGTLDQQESWTQLYWARLWETTQKEDQAESAYRNLLRQAENPKLTLAARQGLERLKMQRTQSRKAAIAEAIADPVKTETGVLVLAPMPLAQKTESAQAMAQIMNLDPYAARMLLPSRGIRLYRVGAVGELEFYGQQLKARGIPVFWLPLSKLQTVAVYPVLHFESVEGKVQVSIQPTEANQEQKSIQFAWSDVAARIEGQIPIFEEVVNRDAHGKFLRKEATQDHANFCDLHLPKQNCILRFSDAVYQFHRGVRLDSQSTLDQPLKHNTAWANWRQLSGLLSQKLPQQPVYSDFESFGEAALDYPELLSKLTPHINLFRREESDWDPAFELYSTLLFLKPLEAYPNAFVAALR
jgi:hypothetical protein